MRSVSPSRALKVALVLDAIVTGAVAMLQLIAASRLSKLLLLPQALLVESGAFLVAYAILLIVLARRANVWSAAIGAIVIGNVAWAAGCIALLVVDALPLTGLGVAFVLVQAITVLVFAALEYRGLKASEPVRRPLAAARVPRADSAPAGR